VPAASRSERGISGLLVSHAAPSLSFALLFLFLQFLPPAMLPSRNKLLNILPYGGVALGGLLFMIQVRVSSIGQAMSLCTLPVVPRSCRRRVSGCDKKTSSTKHHLASSSLRRRSPQPVSPASMVITSHHHDLQGPAFQFIQDSMKPAPKE
jgi:hypothetical protein